MKLYLFDVDGVLCDTGCKIDPEFQSWFIDWSKDNKYALITGGQRTSTIEQVGETIVNNAFMSFHCMGNHIFIKDRDYKINQFEFLAPERYWLETYANNSPYHTKTGNHIEVRTGSVNFSVVGRNASVEQKKEYLEWDNKSRERVLLIKEFTKQFPQYEAFIGGNASIDICLSGANKGRCVHYMGQTFDIIFFGDKCFFGGIDYPLYRNREGSHYIRNGYKDTWEILK